jgi:hypothetical protein
MQKSLDRKLAAIHADSSGAKDFIIADAKDADMAFGIGAAGKSPESHAGETRFRTLAEYRAQIRQIVEQGLVDIMLMSASTNDVLTIQEKLFAESHITPAARANDTSDVFVVRGGAYIQEPSRPFRTAMLDHIQCGHVDCAPAERSLGADLGLYSMTFNNRLDEDLVALEAYRLFRIEAERKGFRHFLEVFDPNAAQGLEGGPMSSATVGHFVNDSIARTLAGVASAGRPVFLKVVYHGPQAMEELVAYDPHLIVGILGGGAGTTYDAFKLIAEAQKYGARIALFGRKINNAENQLAFVEFLRLIVERVISPEDAVRAYHGVLQRLGIKPQRKLDDDLLLQTGVMSYGGGSTVTVPDGVPAAIPNNHKAATAGRAEEPPACGCQEKPPASQPPASHSPAKPSDKCGCGCKDKPKEAMSAPASANGRPDFARMTQAEKLAYNQARRNRIFG